MLDVVVIDDRVTNRNILTRLAMSVEEGIRVKSFASPGPALLWLKETTPDLVITDYKMPDMDGADFIRAFRDLPGAREVPIMVITVYEERSYCYQALEAGAVHVRHLVVGDHQACRPFLVRSNADLNAGLLLQCLMSLSLMTG